MTKDKIRKKNFKETKETLMNLKKRGVKAQVRINVQTGKIDDVIQETDLVENCMKCRLPIKEVSMRIDGEPICQECFNKCLEEARENGKN